ncbi:hypothetical protein ACIQPR_34065 [Streptomyces sp. NPDC091280]|uniref:hypothetical protein n=1 Tax=Streptomyces sp. NPDC091280 TaxID=3365984 RepID=UPI00380DE630
MTNAGAWRFDETVGVFDSDPLSFTFRPGRLSPWLMGKALAEPASLVRCSVSAAFLVALGEAVRRTR